MTITVLFPITSASVFLHVDSGVYPKEIFKASIGQLTHMKVNIEFRMNHEKLIK